MTPCTGIVAGHPVRRGAERLQFQHPGFRGDSTRGKRPGKTLRAQPNDDMLVPRKQSPRWLAEPRPVTLSSKHLCRLLIDRTDE